MEADGRVAKWLATLELINCDERPLALSDVSAGTVRYSRGEAHSVTITDISVQQTVLETPAATDHDSDDDLDVDLAKSALETGRIAFDAKEWNEADALLQEALQILQQLPIRQRTFCDILDLHYRLVVCAFYTQEATDAEQALVSLAQLKGISDNNEHRQYMYDAAHLLSILYLRTGQIEQAKCACERALQGRRRYFGKESIVSLESTALMSHIYSLLNNRARAKACLAMIPEARRDEVQTLVEASLNVKLDPSDPPSALVSSISEDSTLTEHSANTDDHRPESMCSLLPMENCCYGPVSSTISKSPVVGRRPSHRLSRSNGSGLDSLRSITTVSLSSTVEDSVSSYPARDTASAYDHFSANLETHRGPVTGATSAAQPSKDTTASSNRGLSRQEMLRNLRCMPVDRLEEAVCQSDYKAFASLLKKKKNGGSIRSKVQKALHSKRVTALHFAALFGEIEMARYLLKAGFDLNEVPELSTSRLTPLKFAIGARQVEMVEFLVSKGAKPIEPDSWSTLVGQLMDRSWLTNTMSVAERDDVYDAPNRMIAILKIWLKHGWNVNAPYDANSGRTLLQQAIAFESGFYKWDANVRTTITRFLCEHGADPLKPDTKGNTPYDMASIVEDQHLLPVLEQRLRTKRRDERISGLIELCARPPSPVELFDRSTTVPPKLYISELG